MKYYLIKLLELPFKLKAITLKTLLLASILTILKDFVFEYIFDDLRFLIGISLLIAVDTLSGSVAAMVKGEFNIPLFFKKTIRKCAGYVLYVAGTGIMLKLKVGGESPSWVNWLDDYLYIWIGLAEFWSIVQNVDVINPGLIPEKLKKFVQASVEKGEMTKPMISILLIGLCFLPSCVGVVTNRMILHEIRAYKAAQDSIIRYTNLYFRHEELRIDSVYKFIPDAELRRRIDALTKPNDKH